MLTKRQKKNLVKMLLALALIGVSFLYNQYYVTPEQSAPIPAGSYKVVQIEDGDTITVVMDGNEERVRFIGVDTPETKDPRKPVQCFGQAASSFTKNLIGQNPVRLEADPENTNRDRYNRLLRYIYLPDGTLVNAKIIEEGYGFAYTSFPFSKKQEFKNLENQARAENRGLWNECQPTKNQYGGYTSNAQD